MNLKILNKYSMLLLQVKNGFQMYFSKKQFSQRFQATARYICTKSDKPHPCDAIIYILLEKTQKKR